MVTYKYTLKTAQIKFLHISPLVVRKWLRQLLLFKYKVLQFLSVCAL